MLDKKTLFLREIISLWNLLIWSLNGFLSGGVIFFFVYGALQENFIINQSANNPNIQYTGMLISFAVLLVSSKGIFPQIDHIY